MSDNIQETPAQERALTLYKFTNNEDSPYLDTVLGMFYEGAFANTVGIMEAFNVKTSEVETILVGVSADRDGKPECYPIAVILGAEHVPNYLMPNGKGGYFDPADAVEVAEAKEGFKTIAEGTYDD